MIAENINGLGNNRIINNCEVPGCLSPNSIVSIFVSPSRPQFCTFSGAKTLLGLASLPSAATEPYRLSRRAFSMRLAVVRMTAQTIARNANPRATPWPSKKRGAVFDGYTLEEMRPAEFAVANVIPKTVARVYIGPTLQNKGQEQGLFGAQQECFSHLFPIQETEVETHGLVAPTQRRIPKYLTLAGASVSWMI